MGKKRKTTDEFKNEMQQKYGDEYTVLGEYINNKTDILMRHNCDSCNNHEWEAKPYNLLNNHLCPKCAKNRDKEHLKMKRKTTNDFKKEVQIKYGDEYTVLGEYINGKTKIKIRHNCNKCNNYEYEVTPANFLIRNTKCPKCAGTMKMNTDDFKIKMYKIVKNEYTVLGEYKNSNTKILVRHNCDKCNNYEYEVTPSHFIGGRRCPKCNELNSLSYGETAVEEYLTSNNHIFIKQKTFEDCKNIRVLPFDFYLPEFNLLIEFDGKQHILEGWDGNEDVLKEQQKHDRIKDSYCIENNITLLRIAFNELYNVNSVLDRYFRHEKFTESDNVVLYEDGSIYKYGVYKNVITD